MSSLSADRGMRQTHPRTGLLNPVFPLNSLGVYSYAQVANWTNEDIERTSQMLEFKGRIERENWVEQARILASGGHTEFSQRIDRKNT